MPRIPKLRKFAVARLIRAGKGDLYLSISFVKSRSWAEAELDPRKLGAGETIEKVLANEIPSTEGFIKKVRPEFSVKERK